jgi:hypothetical protein
MNNAVAGDASPDDRHRVHLPRRDDRHGRTAALAHHDDTAALSVLVPPPTPVDPLHPAVTRPDMAAKPRTVDLNHAIQRDSRGAFHRATAELVEQDEGGFGVNVEIARLTWRLLIPLAARRRDNHSPDRPERHRCLAITTDQTDRRRPRPTADKEPSTRGSARRVTGENAGT